MVDNIASIRQIASILPKASTEYDVQDKIIPNGNRVIEIEQSTRSAQKTQQVNELNPADFVRLSHKQNQKT